MFQTSCSSYLTNLVAYKEVLSGIPLGLTEVYTHNRGFPGGRICLLILANAGDTGLIPGLERSPEEGNGNPLQYSCLGKPMDRGSRQATAHVVTELDTT